MFFPTDLLKRHMFRPSFFCLFLVAIVSGFLLCFIYYMNTIKYQRYLTMEWNFWKMIIQTVKYHFLYSIKFSKS